VMRQPICDFYNSGTVYITIRNRNNNDVTIYASSVDFSSSHPDSLTIGANISSSVSFPNELNIYPFNSLPPSAILVNDLSTQPGSSSIGVAVVYSDSTYQCTAGVNLLTLSTGTFFSNPSGQVFSVCSSGFVYIQNLNNGKETLVPYNISVVPLPSYSLTPGVQLNINLSSSAVVSTYFVVPFSLSSSSAVTFTVQTTAAASSTWNTYPASSCSSNPFTFNCPPNVYPCISVSPIYPAGNYLIYATVNPLFVPVQGSYNVSINMVLGNTNCVNITSQLSFCAGQLGVNDLYSDFHVTREENTAMISYQTLLQAWPNCNSSVLNYACLAAFRPYLCTPSGATATQYCSSSCLSTLSTSCGNNLCGKAACNQVVGSQCPAPPQSKATSIHIEGILAIAASLLLYSML